MARCVSLPSCPSEARGSSVRERGVSATRSVWLMGAFVLLSLLVTFAAENDPPLLLQSPTLSASHIVFACAGDLPAAPQVPSGLLGADSTIAKASRTAYTARGERASWRVPARGQRPQPDGCEPPLRAAASKNLPSSPVPETQLKLHMGRAPLPGQHL